LPSEWASAGKKKGIGGARMERWNLIGWLSSACLPRQKEKKHQKVELVLDCVLSFPAFAAYGADGTDHRLRRYVDEVVFQLHQLCAEPIPGMSKEDKISMFVAIRQAWVAATLEPKKKGKKKKGKRRWVVRLTRSPTLPWQYTGTRYGNTALLLSGGAGLGIHHVGVLKALYEVWAKGKKKKKKK
jgi:hypothetical protein